MLYCTLCRRVFLVRTPERLTAGKSVVILAKEQENRKLPGSSPLIHFPRSEKKKAESHFTTDETCHVDKFLIALKNQKKRAGFITMKSNRKT